MFNTALGWIQSNYAFMKRILDVVIASTLLVILSPIILIVAIIVALTSNGPVLFWSERKGYKGLPFMMPKFRTMTTDSKIMSREIATDRDVKYTSVGKVLRKLSLDELPQLWSVLIGDMSFIGPRPLLFNDYAMKHRDDNPEVYTVKPGITGLAQVNGRSFITPRNKVRYDTFYAQRVCMILDLKIAIKTIGVVLNTKLVK